MKTITLTAKSQMLHIEAPGCIINITPGLTDANGRRVCHVSVSADGNRYAGNPQWWVNGEPGNDGVGIRVVEVGQ